MARINLKKFIAEHYKGGVTARDVIREALTNAIHAGGKYISVDLHFSERNGDLFQGTEERRVLERIAITDDGEGFTSENLQYFDEVCTSHKDNIGGKGVGRLAFLKYANRVEVRSQLQSQLVEFIYSPDYKPEDVNKTEVNGLPSTSIVLKDLKDKINTQVAKLVNSICDDLRLILFLKYQQGQEATFFVQASGDSMIGAGIQEGALLVVDRALEARHGDIVIAVVDGELTVKRLEKRRGKIRLIAENPTYDPIEFKEGQELGIWGVVTSIIQKLK